MDKKSQYKILEIIGIGSFGKVFAALDLQTKELVALKELRKEQLSTSDFLKEVFCLTTLDHQNIVACRGFEHHRNQRYLIMDYCEGSTLRNLLNSGKKLGMLSCLNIVMQILTALEFAHQKNVIHRDIKPENILLKINLQGWDALLSDFGISAIASKFQTYGMGLTGSPAYMAPEQFYGKFSIHSDLYSVGILLYELVIGERPFNGTPKDLLKAHLSEPIHFPDQIPFLIRNIIAIALRKSPELRFESARDMYRDVSLAAEVLKNEHQVLPLLFATDNLEFLEIKIEIESLITEPIDYLFELRDSELESRSYLACDWSFKEQKQLDLRFREIDSRSLQISSETKIKELKIRNSSYVIIQKAEDYHQLIYFDFCSGQSFNISTTSTQLFWCLRNFQEKKNLIISYYSALDQKIYCQIYKTNSFKQINQLSISSKLDSLVWNLEPFEILSYNSYYGIAFYRDHQNSQTNLQVFNYRGNWVANFLLKTAIAKVIASDADDKLLLATDFYESKSIFLIKLNSFQIERIALSIDPVFIISSQQYFILADQQGHILIYDTNEATMTRHKFIIPQDCEVRSIVCTQNLELIITTWSNLHHQGSVISSKFLVH